MYDSHANTVLLVLSLMLLGYSTKAISLSTQNNITSLMVIFEQIEIFYVNSLHTEIPKYMQKFYLKILLKNTLRSNPKHQQGFYPGHPWAWVMSKSEQEKQVVDVTKCINMCKWTKHQAVLRSTDFSLFHKTPKSQLHDSSKSNS